MHPVYLQNAGETVTPIYPYVDSFCEIAVVPALYTMKSLQFTRRNDIGLRLNSA